MAGFRRSLGALLVLDELVAGVGTATATFVFCDLVGSTELLSRLGNEASEEMRRRYFAVLREAVRATRGEEVKNLGDGLMVAFRTSAGDAVACAVAMQRGIANLNLERPGLPLAIRVGVAAGDAALAAEEDDWFGPAVNTAARLCARARSHQILATEVVAHLVGAGDELFRPIGAVELKGLPGLVPVAEVVWRPREDLAMRVPLPAALDVDEGYRFVGRLEELAKLEAAWASAQEGRGGCVSVVGGPGVGKTRLIRELARHVHSGRGIVLYGRCSLDHDSALRPLGDALRWYLTCRPTSELQDELGEDAAAIATVIPGLRHRLVSAGRLFADAPAEVGPALGRVLMHAARLEPVLLIIDDAHLASSVLIETLAGLVAADGQRLLVVVLMRDDGPTFAESLGHLAGAGVVLEGLAPREVANLLGEALTDADDSWLAELAGSVAAHTGGNPQHVTDVVRNLTSAGLVASPGTAFADVEAQIRAVIDHTCPYRGLAPYGVDDHAFFFGRDDVVAVLVSRLAASRLVGVLGASGSGKSSLVAAGLVPALRRGALPGSQGWPVVLMAPGATPFAALGAALAAVAHVADTPVALERELRVDAGALDRLGRRLVSQPSDRVILVIDQFEDLFTLIEDAEQRDGFLELLERAACAPAGPVALVLALRADFYGDLAGRSGLAQVIESSHVLVGPMSQTELFDAVSGPAFVAGLRLEPGLADTIVRDVAGEAGGLPLLSHALLETWRRREGRTLTMTGYRDAGGVRGSIARSAEALTEALGKDRVPLLRELFLRLVNPGEGAPDTRRRVEAGELPERLRDLVGPLIDARLVTSDDDVVEVAHEALIREWPRLRGWLDEDREGLRIHRRLTQSAAAWERADHDDSELLRGTRLTATLDWVAERRPELNQREVAFLDASRRAEEEARLQQRRQLHRLQGLLVAITIALVAALLAGGLAFAQRGRAVRNAATAREEAVRAREATLVADRNRLTAQSKAEPDRHLAMLLALEANRLGATPDTYSALLRALLSEPRLIGTYPVPGEVSGVQLHGSRLLVGLVDGTVRLFDVSTAQSLDPVWKLTDDASVAGVPGGTQQMIISRTRGVQRLDLDTGRPTGPVIKPDWPDAAWQLSADDQTVFIGGGTGTAPGTGVGRLAAYDASSGRLLWDAAGHSSAIGGGALGVSPDGQRVVTVGTDKTVMVWDSHTGAVLAGPLAGLPAGGVGPPRFSADGRLVAVTSGYPAGVVVFDLTTFIKVSGPFATAGSQEVSAFRPDGNTLAVGNPDGTVSLWNPQSGERVGSPIDVQDVAIGSDVLWSPDGSRLIVPGRRRVAAFDPDGIRTIGLAIPSSTPGAPAWSPDGHYLAITSTDQQVVVVDSHTGRTVRAPFPAGGPSPTGLGPGLAFGPDGATLAVGGAAGVHLVNIASGQQIGPTLWDPALTFASGLAFNADGSLLIIGGAGRARVFDVHSGEPRGPLIGGESRAPAAVAFGPDPGTAYVNTFLGPLTLLDWTTGKPLAQVPHITAFKISLGGLLVTGDISGVQRRDPHTLQPIGDALQLPSSAGTQMALSDAENLLAAAIQSGPIWLVRLDDRYVYTPGFPPGRGGAPSFSPDGKRLATSRPEGGINIWDVDPAVWKQRACELAGRNLSQMEWAKYLPNGGNHRKTCDQWPLIA